MITFTRTALAVDPATEVAVETVTTITGSAIQVAGDPRRYAADGLTLSTMPTLFFTPTTYALRAFTDEFVKPGDTVVWQSVQYVVRAVDPIAPDGFVIVARIIVGVP